MGFFNYFTSISLLLYQITATSVPTAQSLNGTYNSLYSQYFNQGLFLGISYLQAPIGSKRFHPHQHLEWICRCNLIRTVMRRLLYLRGRE